MVCEVQIGRLLVRCQFQQHFLRAFFAAKNYKAEMLGFVILFQLCNFLAPKFRTKNMRVKR